MQRYEAKPRALNPNRSEEGKGCKVWARKRYTLSQSFESTLRRPIKVGFAYIYRKEAVCIYIFLRAYIGVR